MTEQTTQLPRTTGDRGFAARISDLRKTYGSGQAEVHALDGVTLDLYSGEFTAIMGPSGSGKSTLMHCCAALDDATSGTVVLGDTDLSQLNDKALTRLRRDRVGFVFQSFNLVPTLTAEENILLPLSIAGRKPDEEWYALVIDTVGLADRLDHRPNELSGGQQQRVAVARALASRPAVVFADEPTGNLDSRSGAEVLQLLRRSVTEFGQTVVMVTHDPVAAGYTDRVVFLGDGRVVDEMRDPTAERVLERMAQFASQGGAGGLTMLKVTWRNLVARKLRLLLSAFAIVLGVAFVAGSLIFTDAMGGAFDDIVEGSTADVEVAYEGANDWDSQQDSRVIDAAVAEELEKLPEVEGVHANTMLMSVFVIGSDGKVVGGNGAPGLAFNPVETRSITGEPIIEVVEGSLPGPSDAGGRPQVALDVTTAEKGAYDIGDTVTLVTPGEPPTVEAELTGLVEFGSGGLNGATLALLDLDYMQEQFFAGRDVYNAISLNAADGVSQPELAGAAQEVLPEGVVARTGDEVVESNQATIDEVLGFLNTFLLVFAAVALVVGTFLIINTFSILVAQRSRELALLRALGASRRQVNRSVLLEAFGVGVVGSTLGLGCGYLLALALRWIFGRFGLDLAGAEFPVEWTTVAASYVVGILVTVLAAYLPARRASRIAPVQALRDDVAMPESTLRVRLVTGVLLVVVGAALMTFGLLETFDEVLLLLGPGMLAVLIGIVLLSPFAARPVIKVFGLLFRPFGTVGRLATQNSLRNPRRTAATASALMIGLALMAMMSILGSSASASTDVAIEESLTSEFVVSNAIGQPFSTDVAAQIRELDGVDAVAALRQAFPKVKGGGDAWMAAVDPVDFAKVLDVPMAAGTLQALGEGRVLLAESVAEGDGYEVGDTVTLEFQGGDVDVEVAGMFASNGAVPAEWLVTHDTLEKGGLLPLDSMLFVSKEPGASTEELRTGVARVTEELPTVTLKDPQEFAEEQKGQITVFLNLIYGLLGLSVVIADPFGVVNTLALSVIERTREVGLLRAIGVSRRQLRTMIRLEAIVITVFGALLGLAMGLAFGLALMNAIQDEGLSEIVVPWGRLLVFVLAAAVVGVLAAVVPARRAARLDVLRAVTTE